MPQLPPVANVLAVARLVLEMAIIIGCFWVILAPTNSADNVAAFGLLGTVTASLVHNLARRDS